MSNAPLGEIFIDLRLNFDPNTQKLTMARVKQSAKKITKELEEAVAESVDKGMEKGAKKGASKLGRFGFGGGGFGFLTPLNPRVMAAYFSARYMHMAMNALFKTIDEVAKDYLNRYKNSLKEQSTDPTKQSLEGVKSVKDIIPDMPTKTALFLEEVTKGTGLKSTDIASELKKMIDLGVAKDTPEALKKYLDILGYNQAGRERRLGVFGGSESTAYQFKNANLQDNLLDLLSSGEFEQYAEGIDKLIEQSKIIEKQKLIDRAGIIRSRSNQYSIASIEKEFDKSEDKRRKSVDLALEAPFASIAQQLKRDKLYRDYNLKQNRVFGGLLSDRMDYLNSDNRKPTFFEKYIKNSDYFNLSLEKTNNLLLKIIDLMSVTEGKNTFRPPID